MREVTTEMGELKPDTSVVSPGTGIRLISVSFKEASLDSPSFRASINHTDVQLNNIASWTKALKNAAKKMPQRIQDLKIAMNAFPEFLLPSFAYDGVLDQGSTIPLLKGISKGYSDIFTACFELLTIDSTAVIDNTNKISSLLTRYYSIKAGFDSAQDKYDQYYAIYMSSSKFKQAESIIEDAWQLFLTRRAYLHASLDLVILLQEILMAMDNYFINLGYKMWNRVLNSLFSNGFLDFLKDTTFRVQRTKNWANDFDKMTSRFYEEVHDAREQVERTTFDLIEPSTHIGDYNPSLINKQSLGQIEEDAIEKHGYLLMKTWNQNNQKPIWVKRWVFIKGGVFGMLVLSPSKTFVQETDKIGLLLINLRYAAQEERRFCFELRTSDQVITFQAESLIELKSWLKVFENEQARIAAEGQDSQAFRIASTRYPPLLTEFASTVSTVIDKQLTNFRVKDENGETKSSNTLSSKIKQNEQYFQDNLYYQVPLFKPPLFTSNTKSAIISNLIGSFAPLPSALTANMWGSVNWGLYYLHNADSLSAPKFNSSHFTHTAKGLIDVESDCLALRSSDATPKSLASHDVEMRALFENQVTIDEFCLVSFNCLWSPNVNQELSTTIYVSNKSVFICHQAFGFRALFKCELLRLVDVEVKTHKDYDEMKLNIISDDIRLKVYMEKTELIKEKLDMIIHNVASDEPLSLPQLINKLSDIEANFHARHNRLGVIPDTTLSSIDVSHVSGIHEDLKVDYISDYQHYSAREYRAPAKAVFHVLFGENGLSLTTMNAVEVSRTPWKRTPDGKYIASYLYRIPRGGKNRVYLTRVVIEKMIENKYYNITIEKKLFSFMGSAVINNTRLIIRAKGPTTCRVISYCSAEYMSKSPMNCIWSLGFKRFQSYHFNRRHALIADAVLKLGRDGQIGKAIYLYGKIIITEEDNELETPICKIGFRTLLQYVVISPVIELIIRVMMLATKASKIAVEFCRQVTAQRFLLTVIALSTFMNVFLLSRSTLNYWTAHQAHSLSRKLFTGEPMMLERSVHLSDLEELVSFNSAQMDLGEGFEPQSLSSFSKASFIRNLSAYVDIDQEYIDSGTRDVAQGLKKTYDEIGIKRHKLLTEFNMLNGIEKEIAKAEFKNWLVSELRKCHAVKRSSLETLTNSSDITQVKQGLDFIDNYCNQCVEDFSKLNLV